jgi:hypothetical protein
LDLQDLTVENYIDFTKDFKNCRKNSWGQKAEVFSKIDLQDIVNMADELRN